MSRVRKWTCKDGRKVRVCDMTDQHLANTVAMLERNATKFHERDLGYALTASTSLQGEMAQYVAEQEIDRLMESDPTESMPEIYEDMIEEIERRKREHDRQN